MVFDDSPARRGCIGRNRYFCTETERIIPETKAKEKEKEAYLDRVQLDPVCRNEANIMKMSKRRSAWSRL